MLIPPPEKPLGRLSRREHPVQEAVETRLPNSRVNGRGSVTRSGPADGRSRGIFDRQFQLPPIAIARLVSHHSSPSVTPASSSRSAARALPSPTRREMRCERVGSNQLVRPDGVADHADDQGSIDSQIDEDTHWSTRLMAERHGISQQTVSEIWRAFGLKPWRQDELKVSPDPDLIEKIRDLVGLYMSRPVAAAVHAVDEEPQIQALNGSASILPTTPQRATHDYERNGTPDLFAALEIATGQDHPRPTEVAWPRTSSSS